jgi:IS1 family transposase
VDLCGEKRVPKNEEYEDEGTWVWVSMASESRKVLSHAIGERSQMMARELAAKTAKRLATIPLFVTDGLRFYASAWNNTVNGLRIHQPASVEDLE